VFDLKIEGITNVIPLKGTSNLDSFEWQNGQECARLISTLSGNASISLNSGRIRSSSQKIDVRADTYFAYKTGKMIKRIITLEFPASISPSASQTEAEQTNDMPSNTPPGYSSPTPGSDGFVNDDPDRPGAPSQYPSSSSGRSGSTGAEPGGKKGIVQITLVITMEK
jgi:hypothetical protein